MRHSARRRPDANEREHEITITNTGNNFLCAAANLKKCLESGCLKHSIANIQIQSHIPISAYFLHPLTCSHAHMPIKIALRTNRTCIDRCVSAIQHLSLSASCALPRPRSAQHCCGTSDMRLSPAPLRLVLSPQQPHHPRVSNQA